MAATNALTAYGGALVQQFLLGLGASPPAGFTVALGSALVNGALVELTTSDYARQPITFGPLTGTQAQNAAGVTFGPCTTVGGWAVAAVAFCDAVSGTAIWVGLLDSPVAVAQGQPLTFSAGSLVTAFSTLG